MSFINHQQQAHTAPMFLLAGCEMIMAENVKEAEKKARKEGNGGT